MKLKIYKFIIITLFFTSCTKNKSYKDYNKDDFYSVQGIITTAKKTESPFDRANIKDIEFEYFLGDSIKYKGSEKNISLVGLFKGAPIVVLVHKNDKKINFFGYTGTLDSLSYNEMKYIKDFLQKTIDSEN